jgi:hypothetical protein
MNRIRIGVWALVVSSPLACMCARDERQEPAPRSTSAVSLVAHEGPVATAPSATTAPAGTHAAAEPQGAGGTSSSASGGASAGGHGGKNTRNGKDDHNTE